MPYLVRAGLYMESAREKHSTPTVTAHLHTELGLRAAETFATNGSICVCSQKGVVATVRVVTVPGFTLASQLVVGIYKNV